MFCSTEKKNIEELKRILEDYQKAYGQKINLDKSELMFSRNMEPNRKISIKQELGIPMVGKI